VSDPTIDDLVRSSGEELLDSFGTVPTGHEVILTVTRLTRPKGTGVDPRTDADLGAASAEYYSTCVDVLGVNNGHAASHSRIITPAEPSTVSDTFGFDNVDEFDPPGE